jgi:hypothetical protein
MVVEASDLKEYKVDIMGMFDVNALILNGDGSVDE